MIIREREPEVIYTTPSNDWSAVNAIIALIVVAVLGVVVYYFSVANTNRIDMSVAPQPPTVIQMPAAAPATPPITVNTPPAAPSTTNVTVTPPADSTTTTDSTSNQ